MGYERLQSGDIKGAIEIFKLNVAAYPNSPNVYDTQSDAYLADGQKELARARMLRKHWNCCSPIRRMTSNVAMGSRTAPNKNSSNWDMRSSRSHPGESRSNTMRATSRARRWSCTWGWVLRLSEGDLPGAPVNNLFRLAGGVSRVPVFLVVEASLRVVGTRSGTRLRAFHRGGGTSLGQWIRCGVDRFIENS